MMRIKDKHGAWKICQHNPALMEKRKPDDREGEFYTVVSEGMVQGEVKGEIQPARSYGDWTSTAIIRSAGFMNPGRPAPERIR